MKLFDSVQMRAPKRNKFDLSHERKFSFNMGELVPIMVQEVIPGDSFRVKTELMMRLAPMLAPIMHRVNVKVEYFFVPNRLVWDEWESFITGGRLGTDAPVHPQLAVANIAAAASDYMVAGSLWDYMGLPVVQDGSFPVPPAGTTAPQNVTALPFRAYQLIYDEYYRDQNLTASLDVSKASGILANGAEQNKLLTMRKRAWEKDYFTSCLPFAQRGPSVDVPLSDDPTVQTKAYRVSTGGLFSEAGDATIGNTGNVLMTGSATQDGGVHLGAEGHGIDVNSLRRSVRLQEWLERAARVGSRYTELLRGFFGVRPADQRLQRPEFLGGATTPIQISEVLSTVQQVDPDSVPIGTPQGDMTGRGISFGQQNGFSRFFDEHGYVIGIVSVLPRTAYMQSLPRSFQRFDKLDYYWEQFANIGEQAVLNKELFYQGYDLVADADEATFGYQSRYAEYKYGISTCHGNFKADLLFWHMARVFSDQPDLNTSFIEADPTHRIFAVTDESVDKLWCQLYHQFDAIRPMPYFGTPTL